MEDKIRAFLQEQNTYEETDEIIIKELIYNIELAQVCKDEIEVAGTTIESVTAAGSSTKVNPSFTVYNAALKNITLLCTKLGITPQDRAKLKIKKEDDSPGSARQMEMKFGN